VNDLRLSPSTVTAGSGTQVTATGSGFASGESVSVTFTLTESGTGAVPQQVTTTAFSNGTFIVQLPAIPANALQGNYVVTATGANSRRAATALLSVLGAAATATPTATLTPTPTPTSTSTPTLTPTPTVTATTIPPKQTFKIKSAYLWYHNVRLGTSNHVVVQASRRKQYDVNLHVIFPAKGHDLHVTGHTDKNGHWEKTFAVGRHTDSSASHEVLVLVQLQHNLSTKLATLSFTLVH
jgi:hypothetical protein